MSSGSVSPHAVSTPDVVHRVAISTRGLSYSHLEAAEADLPSAGNRFDVPGAGVLYCCTELEGCYRETLARLRTSPRMRALDEDNDNKYMRAGCVPASWRDDRRVFRFVIPPALKFLDVEHQETLTVLDGITTVARDEPLDVAAVRGPNRLLSRAIASWAYTQVDGNGDFRYAGLRYMSRLGQYECWAIFEGTPIAHAGPPQEIGSSDRALRAVAREFDLSLN